jgi:hypothetical protein
MIDLFEDTFEMETCFTEDHQTPFETDFIFSHFKNYNIQKNRNRIK